MTAVLGAGLAIPADRVSAGRKGTRAVARPDEDATTLAVQAAGRALEAGEPRALVLATRTPPYAQGGSTQPVAELLGLQGDLFTCELTATDRDGLAAVRLAIALSASGAGPVLVLAAHADRDDTRTGDGAVALLIGEGDGLAELRAAGSHVEELRDRWRLPGAADPLDADRSFVETIGTTRLGHTAWAAVGATDPDPVLVTGPEPRAAAALERELGGVADPLAEGLGSLGAAHPLLRLLLADQPSYVLSLAGGHGECVHVIPSARGAEARGALRAAIEDGARLVDRAVRDTAAADFDPYASVPRAWRDRGADLRLEGTLPEGAPVPGRQLPTGQVVTRTTDHVYPGGSPTAMAAVDIDGGGRFFGQVTAGDTVAIGDQVQLVPRRLHAGGGLIQYFWKVAPCR